VKEQTIARQQRATHPIRVPLLIALVVMQLSLLTQYADAQSCGSNMFTPAQGDYIGRSSAAAIEFNSAFTMECWAKATGTLNNSALIEKGDGGSLSYAMGLDASGGFNVRLRTSAGQRIYQSPAIQTPNNWHHYAAVIKPGDSVYLFVDGLRWDSFALPELSLASLADSLRIGLSIVQSRISFPGAIDEVRLWSVARSSAQIASAMTTTLLPVAGLAAYYSFDDAPGIFSIHDFSFQNVNARLFETSDAIVPSSSPVDGTLAGFKIAAKERLIDFGVLRCATSFDTVVHLYNRSETDIVVGSLGFASGLSFSVASQGNLTLSKDSASTQPARIHFAAQAGGVYSDTLLVASSSVCGGIVRIPVRATVQVVTLSIDTALLQFGTIPNCLLPATRSVKLHNKGNDTAHITDLEWSPLNDISLLSPVLPITLLPGHDTALVFQLPPGSDGSIATGATLRARECNQQFTISLIANRANIHLRLPPSVTLPTHDANLISVILDTVIALQNSGLIPFYLSNTSVQGNGYSVIKSPSKSYLKPGDTSYVTIRFQTSTCGDFAGFLDLRTNQPCSFDTIIPLQIHIGPPTLSVENDHYRLGSTCTSIDTIVRITNSSDQPVLVKDVVFSSTEAFSHPAHLFPDTLAAHSTLSIPITFAPVHAGDYDATALVIIVPCGDLAFLLSASAGLKGVSVSDTLLGFGRGCDITPVSRTLNIVNDNATDLIVGSADIVGAQKFIVTSPSIPFTVPAHGTRSVDLNFHPTNPGRDDALLTLRSNDNCLINRVHLTGSRETPHLAWSKIRIEFDTTCEGDTALTTVTIFNRGADTVDLSRISLAGSTQFVLLDTIARITAADSAVIRLQYIAKGFGEQSGVIHFTTSPCTTTSTMPVHGSSGPPPQLTISDSVLDFGKVRAGDSVELCFTLGNRSCTAIQLPVNSSGFPPGFAIVSDTGFLSVDRSLSRVICLRYRPKTWDTVNVTRSITFGKPALTIKAIALAPEIHFKDTTIDFGYVLRSTTASLPIRIVNRGNAPDQVSITPPSISSLSLSNRSVTVLPGTTTLQAIFSPVSLGRINDTVVAMHSTGTQRIILRGEGVDSGLVASRLEVDLGDVRVGDSASQLVALTATKGFTISVSQPHATPPFRVDLQPNSIIPITSDKDTVWLYAVLADSREGAFRDTVDIPNSSHPLHLILTGRGVEAHAVATPDTIDFGKVQLGTTGTAVLTVSDSGLYPFIVNSITSASSLFVVLPFTPISQSPPTPRSFTLTFQPVSIKTVQSVVTVHSTALEQKLDVVVKGRGTYGPAGRPDVSYHFMEADARVGDHLLIPLIMHVSSSSALLLDSVSVEVQFDPYSVFFSGVTTQTTLSDGLTTIFTHTSDSTIHLSIVGRRAYSDGVITMLNAEALLGPHDTSRISVAASIPENALLPQDADGLFVVKDCGGQPGNVVIAASSTKAVTPNPASSTAQIAYSLPGEMHVRLLIFDVLGKLVRRAVDHVETSGDHVSAFDCSGIPSGKYIYQLECGERIERGSLVISH
jgi:hypothetical protein